MRTPRAVLFDLDDTLVHRTRSIEAYARTFCADFGERLAGVHPDAVAALLLEADHGGYLRAGSPFASIQQAVAVTLSKALAWSAPAAEDELRRHWVAGLPVHGVEMPGAGEVVRRLASDGLHIGIVSNGAERTRAATVAAMPWHAVPGCVVSSERAGFRKPDPRIFLVAARELGVDAGDCWVVGDHPVNDIGAAEAAGMTGIWLRGFHRWDGVTPPASSIDSLAQLPALVEAARRPGQAGLPS